jgi:small subunit ribosomal protein S16
MVRIRLRRVGGKKQPSYRIVAADKESPRDGRFLEILGFYNPRTEPPTLNMQEDRIYAWMSNGAQPSESVEKLFKSAGLLDRFDRYKKGESIEVLLEEAEAAEEERTGSLKTTHVTPSKSKKSKAKAQAEVEAEPEPEAKPTDEVEAEALKEPEAEAPEEPEAEAPEEPEAEAPEEPEAEAPEEPEAEAPQEPEAEAETSDEPKAEAPDESDAKDSDEPETEPEAETPAEPDSEE